MQGLQGVFAQGFATPESIGFARRLKVLAASLAIAGGMVSTAMAAGSTFSPVVAESALRAHLAFLSSDLLEGRGTGQRGGDLAVTYLETQARVLGLQSIDGKTYRHSLKLAESHVDQAASNLHFEMHGQALPLTLTDDWVWSMGDAQNAHQLDADVVFVGYGISAPDEHWDDYKGGDYKGKLLIMMVNDPQPTATEPNRFGGESLTYYGRWTYKYEEAKRRGAAGVILIHTDQSASYQWSVAGNAGNKFLLLSDDKGTPIQGWINDAAAHKLFAAAGQDLDVLRAAAEHKDFQPVHLPLKLKGDAKADVRVIEQFNVAGLIPGTDPVLKDELVIYSAHWDHLGIKQGSGDVIYNGAVDNGSGSAALLAMAQAAVQKPTKRSQLFLWVAAEEKGLIGSKAFIANSPWPLKKIVADLNLDSMNFVGRTKDIGVPGSQRTDLAGMAAKVAAQMQLNIAKPAPDKAGGYFRSDHFNFAKAGIPAFSVSGGRDYINDPVASTEKAQAYGKRYHQVTDEYDPTWDLSGMTQQAQFTLNLGRYVGNAAQKPLWKPGAGFGSAGFE
jgi:Zn-dependent M28 family amino/carboxypeptidase